MSLEAIQVSEMCTAGFGYKLRAKWKWPSFKNKWHQALSKVDLCEPFEVCC